MNLEKSEIVIIGGCGHVGLPLGLVLANLGHNVVAYDIDLGKIEQVNLGVMPFKEVGAEDLLVKVLNEKSFPF